MAVASLEPRVKAEIQSHQAAGKNGGDGIGEYRSYSSVLTITQGLDDEREIPWSIKQKAIAHMNQSRLDNQGI